MTTNECYTPPLGNRRSFWTWQPCDTGLDECGNVCADWGLKYICSDGACDENYTPGDKRTVETSKWLRSLIVSILGTNGRLPDTYCGYRPGSRGGHWSDSFHKAEYAATAGSLVRTLRPRGTISEAARELKATVEYDLKKLITYNVASKVAVDVKVGKANVAYVDITVYGTGTDQKFNVGLNATRLANAWTWDY